ncbi:hypothetical protein EIP86_010172 [Pleurotus ostreatoroseus]|nr:hypothetical protein EIP86_010172 [Pleurotus ostreatoroseus]
MSTMFFLDPQSVLLVVPRNIVTAVGLPLVGGFFSGSYTSKTKLALADCALLTGTSIYMTVCYSCRRLIK